jgi:hypothetical protein
MFVKGCHDAVMFGNLIASRMRLFRAACTFTLEEGDVEEEETMPYRVLKSLMHALADGVPRNAVFVGVYLFFGRTCISEKLLAADTLTGCGSARVEFGMSLGGDSDMVCRITC